eukprot:g19635.t1
MATPTLDGEGFQELLKAQVAAIQQVLSLNQALARKFEGRDLDREDSRSPLNQLSDPERQVSDPRSPLSAISRQSLRTHALQFGSKCRQVSQNLCRVEVLVTFG